MPASQRMIREVMAPAIRLPPSSTTATPPGTFLFLVSAIARAINVFCSVQGQIFFSTVCAEPIEWHGRNHKQSQRTCGELHSVPPNAVSCAVEFLWLRCQSDVKRCEAERSEIGSRTEKTEVGSQRWRSFERNQSTGPEVMRIAVKRRWPSRGGCRPYEATP